MIFPVALGALAGSVAVSSLESLPSLLTLVGIAAVAAVISVAMRFSMASVFALCTALAALHASVWAGHQLSQRLPDHLDRQSVWMEVVITDLPTRHERGWRFEARVLSARMTADEASAALDLPKRGVIHWYRGETEGEFFLAPGERWQFQARLKAPAGSLNPGGFDLEAWMLEKKLYFTATVQQGKSHFQPRFAGIDKASFALGIDQLRDRIRGAIDRALPGSEARAVLSALVVGDQRAISAGDWALFQKTGVSHLMSISGLHVTMFAALLSFLGKAFWRLLCRRPIYAGLLLPVQSVGAICAVLGAFGYALLAGFAIPAQRTAWMVGAVSLASLLGLRASPWASISIALVVIVFDNPMACLSPGFWLSFFAVLMLFGDSDGEIAPARRSLKQKFIQALGQAGRAQIMITFGLLPLTVYFFQQIVVVGPLANALAIPVVSFLVTPLAMAGSVLAVAIDYPGILMLAAWIQTLLQEFLAHLAGFSWASLAWPAPGPIGVAVASLGAAIALSQDARRKFGRFCHFGWVGMAALIFVNHHPLAAGDLEVTFLDVGQGSSVLIRTANSALLFDAGPAMGGSDAGARIVVPVLRRLGVRSLDTLVISHLDADHAGGAPAVWSEMNVGQLLSSQLFTEKELSVAPKAARQNLCEAGQKWSHDGVHYQVLHPTAELAQDPRIAKDRNALSCVLHISNGQGASVLLAGDLPSRQEMRLSAMFTQLFDPENSQAMQLAGASISAKVLLASHHGSKTSSSAIFLDAVDPRWVVIQAGYRNRFGHPHPDVLQRLSGRLVLRTDLHGQIRMLWRSGSKEPEITNFWADGKRYWHRERNAN